jgi:hypothetical protein
MVDMTATFMCYNAIIVMMSRNYNNASPIRVLHGNGKLLH